MSRIPAAPLDQFAPIFGADAPLRQQIYAQAPGIAGVYLAFQTAVRANTVLPRRLIELVRLRISFHNQCRSCMAIRYTDGADAGVTEDLVCSLEKPEEAPDLSEAEKAALVYADKAATDHLSITDETFALLAEHFTAEEQMDLCFQVAGFVGYGRMGSALDMIDDLPEEYGEPDAVLAPWRQAPAKLL